MSRFGSKTDSPVSNNSSSVGDDAMSGIGTVVVKILTAPVRLIIFLTSPPGSAILIGFGVIYFFGVSAEGYWQAMPPHNQPAFIPKPFINDAADFRFVGAALISTAFWMASLVSLIIQGIQAFVLREYEISKAKALYDSVSHYRVPEGEKGQLDIAEYRRRKLKSVGMRTVRTRGALIALTYLIDFAQAFWNYPLTGQSAGMAFVHLVWVLCAVFGTEAMINLFWNAIAPIKPQVEVLPNN